jgi:ubiquinone/menaquinone biosynthesis C-methylase UbiE
LTEPRDAWAAWLLERRFGGDAEQARRLLEHLGPVRDRVLDGAAVREGDVVLDVGAGDGLIAFGALQRVGESGSVVFSDVSEDLLEHGRRLAGELGAGDRMRFVHAAAQDLSAIADSSVDVVTTRSVLIYVPLAEKPRVFEEFARVLRPGGRVSMFEPINAFGRDERRDHRTFLGLDTAAIVDLVTKVEAVYDARAQGEETLVDFDERDLLTFAERAGFVAVELAYEARIKHGSAAWGTDATWEVLLRSSGNPCAPTFGEVLDEALTADERRRFEGHVRPAFEARTGTHRSAVAYLRARVGG